jgi:hypothetical protein
MVQCWPAQPNQLLQATTDSDLLCTTVFISSDTSIIVVPAKPALLAEELEVKEKLL